MAAAEPPSGGNPPTYPPEADPNKADSYTDAQIRTLIIYINQHDPSNGLPYGPHGEKWPSAINAGESRHTAVMVIIEQYLTLKGIAHPPRLAYPNPDPGEAIPGIGPTGDLFGWLKSPLDFLKVLLNANLWLRIGEGILGLLLIASGIAKVSGAANTAIKAFPAGRLLTK